MILASRLLPASRVEVLVAAAFGSRDTAARQTRPRTGLVLGAGGVLGAAWMTGALPAVQDRLPCAAGDVDVIIGTSAGSVLAAALRCGASLGDLVAHQQGQVAGALGELGLPLPQDGPLPPLPHWRVGSPRLMRQALLAPHRVPPWVGATGWVPRGRGNHREVRAMVEALHGHHRGRAAAVSPPHWVDAPTWVVAVDYDSGQRVVFGRDGAPAATLSDAVVASCSIPGWYEPAVIGGRRYVDGGVRSATSLGLMAQAGVDEVWVLAPMASTVTDHPRRPQERLERRLRRLITHALLREVRALRSRGLKVTVLTPGPEDLAAIGANLMDPRRREAVLSTSLRTSAAALARQPDGPSRVA
jgi:NTE family protein